MPLSTVIRVGARRCEFVWEQGGVNSSEVLVHNALDDEDWIEDGKVVGS